MSESDKTTAKKAPRRARLYYLKDLTTKKGGAERVSGRSTESQGTIRSGTIRLRKSQKKLVLLKAAFLTERLGGVSHLAEVVQADKSRISRWAKGSVPDKKNSQAITDLEFVYQRLSRFLNDNSADKWLESVNAHLRGRRPLDVLHEGRIVDVLAAANQEEAGSYA